VFRDLAVAYTINLKVDEYAIIKQQIDTDKIPQKRLWLT
jgi:hypothetical protein